MFTIINPQQSCVQHCIFDVEYIKSLFGLNAFSSLKFAVICMKMRSLNAVHSCSQTQLTSCIKPSHFPTNYSELSYSSKNSTLDYHSHSLPPQPFMSPPKCASVVSGQLDKYCWEDKDGAESMLGNRDPETIHLHPTWQKYLKLLLQMCFFGLWPA